MGKILIIVESPAKAHKIQEYVGDDYIVTASKGHITDLAKGGKHGLGIDIENNFRPKYVLLDDKLDVVDNLLSLAKQCDSILIFSDPDREGEAIAWHLADRLADVGKPIKRGVFNEIKKTAILKAIKNLRDIDMNLFHSQEARRILDRLVGFTASPFLMNLYGSNPPLSAGRVQSVVTRMVIDREREIEQFVPEEFWTIQVSLNDGTDTFKMKYANKLIDEKTAKDTKNILSNKDYLVKEVIAQPEKKYPQPPLVTATLQRIMSKQHGISSDRTMKAAQSLYENGYCTYIRTDSVRVGAEALEEVRAWIGNKYELPKKPYVYRNKEAAQDAHECIRPSDINLLPWDNYAMIDPDEKLVYEAIWRQFVASQMMPAVYDTLSVTAHPNNDPKTIVKASGKALTVNGFLDIASNDVDVGSIDIPNLSVGQALTLDNNKDAVKLEKKQTQPPPRYSEHNLIKELENKGIGRPATYSELLVRITGRNYVEKKGQIFHATDLGRKITDELIQYFTFMDYNYTATMEKQLDEIESGKANHIDMLKKFYPSYRDELNKAYMNHGSQKCDMCQGPMIVRKVKSDNSSFLGCVNYPKCHYTKPA